VQSTPDSPDRPLDPEDWHAKHDMIAAHLEGPVRREEWVQTVEYDPAIPRWYVRFGCEGRDAATIYFDLHQRTLRYEVYFMPDPPAHHEELYRFLLQRNHTTYAAHFSIGPDGDLYLVGRVLLEHLDVHELDRIIGVLYELVERWFQPAIRLGFGKTPGR
jgi:Putative bacterial sensory transduction regulator